MSLLCAAGDLRRYLTQRYLASVPHPTGQHDHAGSVPTSYSASTLCRARPNLSAASLLCPCATGINAGVCDCSQHYRAETPLQLAFSNLTSAADDHVCLEVCSCPSSGGPCIEQHGCHGAYFSCTPHHRRDDDLSKLKCVVDTSSPVRAPLSNTSFSNTSFAS